MTFSTTPMPHARSATTCKTYGATARQLGWSRARTDSDERHQRRRNALAAVATHDPVLAKQAEGLFDTWLAKRTGIADDLVSTVLALVVERGGAARFEQVLAETRKPRDRIELTRLLTALGATRDPVLAKRAFELVRGKELDLRDSQPLLRSLLSTREVRMQTFELVEKHIDELLARMRDDEASWFLTGLASGACDPALRTRVAALVTLRAAKVGGAKAPVERGLEQSDQCIAAMTRQLPALKKFLAGY